MTQTGPTWTIRRLLEWTTAYFTRQNVDAPRLSAELLLAHVLSLPRIQLYTGYERLLNDAELAGFRALVQRAAKSEPIAYLTGKAHFFNLELEITPQVLIPRPDTETLVENVLQMARHDSAMVAPRILDLCTGSGCVAAAIAQHLKNSIVVAIDLSAPSVEVARRNIEKLGLASRVTILHGDLFAPLSKLIDALPFQVVVANPPYIPTGQIQSLDRSVRDFEPTSALDGGLDGLTLHRRILQQAPAHLTNGGRLFLEIAFDHLRILKDHAGRDRVLALRKK